MSKTEKILYGICSLLPIILIIGFFISLMGPLQSLMETAAWNSNDPRKILPSFPDFFASAFTLMILLIITTVGLLILFSLHAYRNASLSSNERVVWLVLFFLAGTFAFPVYFFVHIWNASPGVSQQLSTDA
jgi:Trk-type K+ transport system membrane component